MLVRLLLSRVHLVLQRRTVSICREGLYYFFVLAFIVGGATLREKNLLFILAGMMLGPLLFNWRIVVLSLRRFDVQRRLPPFAFAGQPLRVEICAAAWAVGPWSSRTWCSARKQTEPVAAIARKHARW
jgi:hypothetical protein